MVQCTLSSLRERLLISAFISDAIMASSHHLDLKSHLVSFSTWKVDSQVVVLFENSATGLVSCREYLSVGYWEM